MQVVWEEEYVLPHFNRVPTCSGRAVWGTRVGGSADLGKKLIPPASIVPDHLEIWHCHLVRAGKENHPGGTDCALGRRL